MNDHIVICEHNPAVIIEEHHYQMTRKRARTHYDLTAVTGDRPLNMGRLAILEEAITNGTFYGNPFAAAYCDELGDEKCRKTMQRYADRMARSLASIINVLDPDVIVLGGGVSNIKSIYKDVPRLWGSYVFSDRVDTKLVHARHGDSSGVRGAAWLWPV